MFFYTKRNDLIEFKDTLKLFYDETEEINPNNEEQKKDLVKKM